MFGKVAKLEKLCRQNPDVPLFARLADLYLSRGMLHRALSLCEQNCEQFSDYPTGYVILSKCYETQGEFEKARVAMDQALRLDPDNPGGFKRLSGIYQKLDIPMLALKSLQQATHLDPLNQKLGEEVDQLNAAVKAEPAAPSEPEESSEEKEPLEEEILEQTGETLAAAATEPAAEDLTSPTADADDEEADEPFAQVRSLPEWEELGAETFGTDQPDEVETDPEAAFLAEFADLPAEPEDSDISTAPEDSDVPAESEYIDNPFIVAADTDPFNEVDEEEQVEPVAPEEIRSEGVEDALATPESEDSTFASLAELIPSPEGDGAPFEEEVPEASEDLLTTFFEPAEEAGTTAEPASTGSAEGQGGLAALGAELFPEESVVPESAVAETAVPPPEPPARAEGASEPADSTSESAELLEFADPLLEADELSLEVDELSLETEESPLEFADPLLEADELSLEVDELSLETEESPLETEESPPEPAQPPLEKEERAPGSGKPSRPASGLAPRDDHELIRIFQEIDQQRRESASGPSSPKGDSVPSSLGDQDSQIATITLAEIYSHQGLVQRAIETYRQILEQQPDNEEIQRRLADLEQRA